MEASSQMNPDLKNGSAILIQRQIVRYSGPYTPATEEDLKKAEMSDAYITQRAREEAAENYKNSFSAKVEKGLVLAGIPIIASITEGALKEGNAIQKVKNTLKAGKWWALAVGGLFAASKAIDVAAGKVPEIKEFSKEHPVPAFFGSLAVALGGILAANPIADAIGKQAGKLKLKEGETLASRAASVVNDSLNKLKGTKTEKFLDSKIFKPTKNFLTANPIGRFMARHAGILIIGGVIAKLFTDSLIIDNDRKKIQQELEQERMQSIQKVNSNPFDGSQEIKIRKREINRIILVSSEENETKDQS